MAKRKIPGVFSIQRALNVTDALFYNAIPNGKDVQESPLYVLRHGIRGTQNVAKEKKTDSKPEATTAASTFREVSNVQITDSAKTAPDAEHLIIRFSVKTIDILRDSITSCARSKNMSLEEVTTYKKDLLTFIENVMDSQLETLCLRYVRNLTNGRWLWRNRTQAEDITIEIATHAGENFTFNAFAHPLNSFDNFSEDEKIIAQYLAQGFQGDRNVVLHIKAAVDFGCNSSIEVFPSQNYLSGKEKGFARSLYYVGREKGGDDTKGNIFMGQAALRDQKIGNALRTIDTWYDGYSNTPIAIEPNGANLESQEFLRKGKSTAFSILAEFDELKDFEKDETQRNKALFLLACIIRGGVYSDGGE